MTGLSWAHNRIVYWLTWPVPASLRARRSSAMSSSALEAVSGDIMSSPPVVIDKDTSLKDAAAPEPSAIETIRSL